MDPEALGEALAYNYLENRPEFKTDVSLLETDLAATDYFSSGKDVADLSILLLGPAPSELVPLADYSNTIDLSMINHILAGFIYGMTTDNHLTEIEACYAGGAEMDHELTKAV